MSRTRWACGVCLVFYAERYREAKRVARERIRISVCPRCAIAVRRKFIRLHHPNLEELTPALARLERKIFDRPADPQAR
jgi:hypothetical protein